MVTSVPLSFNLKLSQLSTTAFVCYIPLFFSTVSNYDIWTRAIICWIAMRKCMDMILSSYYIGIYKNM